MTLLGDEGAHGAASGSLIDRGRTQRPPARRTPAQRAAAHTPRDLLVERNRLLEMQNRELQQTVRRLRQLAFVDGLTELANRRCFELTMRSEIRRACRAAAPLSLILCDVDHFKLLNDRSGHQTGDAVLCMIASVLRANCRRAGDLAARYGGEEFALLLAATSFREAIEMAERLRRGVEALPIPNGAAGPGPRAAVTLSLGVTTFHSHTACEPSELVQAADAALYRAKEAGRNRTRYQLPA